MNLTGLHLLLTYQCIYECDHCFLWGSPRQQGSMSLETIHKILHQAKTVKSINNIYFEGGEPFLYYPILLKGIKEAVNNGYKVGIVSNGYWATSEKDALEWLIPFKGLIQDLSISCDSYHGEGINGRNIQFIKEAGKKLNISLGFISIAQPEEMNLFFESGKFPEGKGEIMYRGRASKKLIDKARLYPWSKFTECPYEDLKNPGRVHVDPMGNLHLCQGMIIGNLFNKPLKEVLNDFSPESNPVIGPLLRGGPAGLCEEYQFPHVENYADACHLCYETRVFLRLKFPEILTPDQAYGIM